MNNPPALLDGAHVLMVADVGESTSTGRTSHVSSGHDIDKPAILVLARYDDEPGVYLFYCDSDWTVLTDTFHETLVDAVAQARFEFDRVDFFGIGELGMGK